MSYPIGAMDGLVDAAHKRAMGGAVWYFLLLLSWQTDKAGTVRHGEEISNAELGAWFGESERSARRQMEALETAEYVGRKRGQHGYMLTILNPKKPFKGVARSTESVRSKASPDRPNLSGLTTKVVRSHDKSCPVSATLHSSSVLQASKSKQEGAREALEPLENPLPIDAFEQLRQAYPSAKASKIRDARVRLDVEVIEGRITPENFSRILGAAKLVKTCPAGELRFQPSLADFIGGRWEDDWPAIIAELREREPGDSTPKPSTETYDEKMAKLREALG